MQTCRICGWEFENHEFGSENTGVCNGCKKSKEAEVYDGPVLDDLLETEEPEATSLEISDQVVLDDFNVLDESIAILPAELPEKVATIETVNTPEVVKKSGTKQK